ncbi:hypothetical protein BMS3Abin09_01301 [bacterium BMS3Abin09]|nr:hypothetical protein BMS3Abin09_01301 [bacterium BMS3Abin09]
MSVVMSWPVSEECAPSLIMHASRSLVFDFTLLARKKLTSSGRCMPSISDFFPSMAIFVSTSGIWISAISPIPNLERSLSVIGAISFGGLSLEKIICLWESYRALNVWKSSSCVPLLPAMNCMSSIIRTSRPLYFFLNSSILSFLIEYTNSFVNCSAGA